MINTMRHLYLALLMGMLAVSCNKKGDSSSAVNAPDSGLPADTSAVVLAVRPHVGEMMKRVFMGTCEDDATCILTLFNYEFSGDGIFSLTLFRPGNELSVYKGKVYTLRGTDDATLWQCITTDGEHTFYFLVGTDGQKIYKVENDRAYTQKHALSRLSATVAGG